MAGQWSHSPAPQAGWTGYRLGYLDHELTVAYLMHAEDYYRKDGEPTAEVGYIKLALRPLRKLYGTEQARDFGPRKLQTVRQTYIGLKLTRTGSTPDGKYLTTSGRLIPATLHLE